MAMSSARITIPQAWPEVPTISRPALPSETSHRLLAPHLSSRHRRCQRSRPLPSGVGVMAQEEHQLVEAMAQSDRRVEDTAHRRDAAGPAQVAAAAAWVSDR